MKRLFAVLFFLAACGAAIAAETVPQPKAPPTLDHAILVFSSVDRSEVYLGESIDLTLEYWELDVRGLKAQPLYRGGGITLPAMEGFYAGPMQSETEEGERDGANYKVTRHRQRIYPTIAGDLEIGPWRWQGSVRGYVASGPQSKTVDLSTAPIGVQVLPLPAPPPAFRGAVGEYELSLTPSSANMTQGEPASLSLEMRGSGNPATLEAPSLPEASWYRLGNVAAEGEIETVPNTGTFKKRFRVEFMPLKPGTFTIDAVPFTYFSPGERQYKRVQSEAFAVQVTASGPAESLVVIRGAQGTGGRAGLMEDGKLALAPAPSALVLRREYPGMWYALFALPPLVWLGQFLYRGGWRGLTRKRGHVSGESEWTARIAALANLPEPIEELRGMIRGVLVGHLGVTAAGLEDRELPAALDGVIASDASACIAAALQACEEHRFGKRSLTNSEVTVLIQGLPRALAAVERCPRREAGEI